jgi:hypothetical protein
LTAVSTQATSVDVLDGGCWCTLRYKEVMQMKIPGVYCKFSLLFFSAYTRENFNNLTTTHGKISTSCPWCLGNFLELFHGAWHNQFPQLSLVNLIQER